MSSGQRIRHEVVRTWVLRNLPEHERDLVAALHRVFGLERQAANWHVRKLVKDGILTGSGKTRAKRYEFHSARVVDQLLPLATHSEEHEVWRLFLAPALQDIAPNVKAICAYGFNEMFNNAAAHSGSDLVSVRLDVGPGVVSISVMDFGIGIFRRIQDALGYATPQDVVLELSKGKLTTDPSRHTGEGIFFTSRMFDRFTILSGTLFWACTPVQRDWLLEDREEIAGTAVGMKISPMSSRTDDEVFDRYSKEGDLRFSRTEVPIFVAELSEDPLVSRSAARRILARLERFDEVVLNFNGVRSIGPAFADEIFRVFALEHPEVTIRPRHANRRVSSMIERARAELASYRDARSDGSSG